jgi:formate dehydrogenase subunit gamma
MPPILHALRHEFGYVGEAAASLVGQELNLTRAEAHGVITILS